MTPAPTAPDWTDAQQMIAEIQLRRYQRRRWIALALAVVILPSIYPASVAVRHMIASTYLESQGFIVSWECGRSNWTQGGVTSADVSPPLFGNSYGKPHLSHLARLHRLESLDLSKLDSVDDAALAVLSALTDLRVLNLDQGSTTWLNGQKRLRGPLNPHLTDATLARIGKLTMLRDLNLAGHQMTDAGAAHLAGLNDLEMLDLKDTPITDAGLEPLKALKHLKYIDLHGTKVSAAGCRALKLALPEVDVNADFDPFAPASQPNR